MLSGCIQIKSDEPASAANVPQPIMVETKPVMAEATPVAPAQKPELLKVTGIGYGAESTFAAYTPGQRRLMAIRSSKLDAYRALAEQLYGIKIDSNTSVSTLTAKNDSFRARVNAVVKGARVVSVTPMADRNYETVLEVYVDKKFFEQAFVYTASKASIVEPEQAYKVSSY
ncbi:LPP20 family lipoprotein [Thiomicrorhabdus sp. Milos-T2]|uniref:LPP20 family lipoprotein n=1 Tax=Thiomicrorhabdus sp. Milos-T2 TaxID=90814 RepID=UPI00068E6252|nr:LPP20 family lipoprotein [Thiomicrorhabdus sp. Milos-T2]